jgi:hypothetical protein
MNSIDVISDLLEENDFNVHIYSESKRTYAEIETWTDGGVNMIITLDPFTIDEFKCYVDNFDIDEEIDLYRQGKLYKERFTISESLKDFKDYHKRLKKLLTKLNKLK